MKLPRFSFVTHVFELNKNVQQEQQTSNVDFKASLQKFSFSPRFKQNLAAAGPLLLTIATGMTLGYSAILLPQLQSKKNDGLPITKDQASWVASMAAPPMAFGAIFGGILSEKFGRKTAHILTCLPLFIGWLVIYLAINIEMILAGRFLTGFCAGILVPATGVYIGEVTQPRHRGILLGGISLSISIGLLLIHILGTYLHWKTTASIACTLPLLSWALLLLSPESPSWLIKKGWVEKAEDSFYWFRGVNAEAKQEIDAMLKNQVHSDDTLSFRNRLNKIFEPQVLKPLGYLVVLMVCSQGAGINAVNFYSVKLVEKTVPHVDSYVSTIILDVIRVFASVLGCIFIKKFGRRPLLIYTGLATTVTLLILSLFSYSSIFLPQFTSSLFFIPLISLVLYTGFVVIAFVAVPWALIGELLPLSHRSLGGGIASFCGFMFMFVIVKTMPHLFDSIGAHGTFLIYAIFSLIAIVSSYFFLPETKGKTLNQIEDIYKSDKVEMELNEQQVA